MDELLDKVKANLIVDHDVDDSLLLHYITAATAYAESYQHIPEGFYSSNPMPPTTRPLLCCRPTFMSQGTAARAAFLQTTFLRHNRCGTQ